MEPAGVKTRRKQAIEIVREANDLLLDCHGKSIVFDWKGTNDLKTAADDASERFICGRIRELFPDDAILAEEGTIVAGNKLVWFVDPLDGTWEFRLGFSSYFAVSIGVGVGKTALFGIIGLPARGEIYYSRPEVAFCNDRVISVVAPDESAHAVLLLHGGKVTENKVRIAQMEQRLIGNMAPIPYVGSAATCLALVASGRANAYVGIGMDPWDLAGGVPICVAAGGKATKLDGTPWQFGDRDAVLSHPDFHDWIIEETNK